MQLEFLRLHHLGAPAGPVGALLEPLRALQKLVGLELVEGELLPAQLAPHHPLGARVDLTVGGWVVWVWVGVVWVCSVHAVCVCERSKILEKA